MTTVNHKSKEKYTLQPRRSGRKSCEIISSLGYEKKNEKKKRSGRNLHSADEHTYDREFSTRMKRTLFPPSFLTLSASDLPASTACPTRSSITLFLIAFAWSRQRPRQQRRCQEILSSVAPSRNVLLDMYSRVFTRILQKASRVECMYTRVVGSVKSGSNHITRAC